MMTGVAFGLLAAAAVILARCAFVWFTRQSPAQVRATIARENYRNLSDPKLLLHPPFERRP
jgi:hypothetical protein